METSMAWISDHIYFLGQASLCSMQPVLLYTNTLNEVEWEVRKGPSGPGSIRHWKQIRQD